MIASKPWWASRTIWGGLIVLLVAVLRVIGIDIDEQLQADIGAWVEEAALVAAAGLVIWGRVTATRRIGAPPINGASRTFSLLPAACCLLLLCGGCSTIEQVLGRGIDQVDIDADRYRFAEPVFEEHAERHPEQAQTVRNFLAVWRESIRERGGSPD